MFIATVDRAIKQIRSSYIDNRIAFIKPRESLLLLASTPNKRSRERVIVLSLCWKALLTSLYVFAEAVEELLATYGQIFVRVAVLAEAMATPLGANNLFAIDSNQ